MKPKLALGIALAIFVLLFMTFCDLSFDLSAPNFSLDVTAQTVYDSANNVVIQFSFTGEEDKHLCKYSIAKNGGTSFFVVEEGEVELLSGVTYNHTDISSYSYDNGHYRFSFSVLLARNGGYDTPPFLEDSVDFWVDPTGPSGLVSISPGGGSYNSAQQVVLDHSEIDAIDGSPSRIFYTTDGSNPTTSSSQYEPGNPVVVSTNTTFKAIAIDMADRASGISSETYEIDIQAPVQPGASLVSGTYGTNTVDLSHDEYPTSTGGTPVSLYYTLDGTTPDVLSSEYSGTAITLPEGSVQLRAVAIDEVGNTSTELVADYIIDTIAPVAPSLDYLTDDYSTPFSLSSTHAEIPTPSGTDVQIFYTIGSIDSPPADPDTGSTLYTAPIPIDRNRVLKAIAIDAVGNTSSIVSRAYTFLRIDSVTPASFDNDTEIIPANIAGFFFDKLATNVFISDGLIQDQVFLDVDVSSTSNLRIMVLKADLIDMNTGPGTLSVVNANNGDSVSFPITIF